MLDQDKSKQELIEELAEMRRRVAAMERVDAERKSAEEALRESDERFKLFMDNSPAIAWMKDEQGRYVYVNESYGRRIGMRPEDRIGKTDFELWPAATAELFRKNDQKVLSIGQVVEVVEESITPGGNRSYCRNFKFPFQDSTGRRFVGGVGIDVTERIQAAEALKQAHDELEQRVKERTAELVKANEQLKRQGESLRESESKYRTLFETMSQGAFYRGMDGTLLDANEAALKIFGLTREEFLRGNPDDRFRRLIREDGSPLSVAEHPSVVAMKTGKPVHDAVAGVFDRRTQGYVWMIINAIPEFRQGETTPFRVVVTIHDNTERKQAADKIRESNNELRAIYDGMFDGLLVADIETKRLIKANAAIARMLGYSEIELLSLSVKDIHPQADMPFVIEQFQALAEGKIQVSEDLPVMRKDGSVFFAVVSTSTLIRDDRPCLVGFFHDVTQRKRAESAIRESEQRLKNVINSPLVAIGIGDATGRITEANDAFVQLLGFSREELLSGTVSWRGLTPPEYTDMENQCVEELERTGKFGPCEKEKFRKDGTRVPILVGAARLPGAAGEHVAFIVDITDRKRAEQDKLEMERRLLHAQKLESIGVLAGGIAHDFNNILAGIMGYADLSLAELPASEPARGHIEVIKKAVLRAADLTRQMLAYSGKGKFIVEPVDLSRVIEDSKKMLAMSVSKKATVTYNLTSNPPVISADAAQMCQVVMNLVINASEALGEHGGVIAVTTNSIHCLVKDLCGMVLGQDLPEGDYVYLEVADTGCGMDEQTLAKIFDPFFTTKFTGRGLGLAGVHGIVQGHKGAIQVSSAPGKGTTFRVLFPAAGFPAPAARSESTAAPVHSSGMILVVDDEDTIRTWAQRMLGHSGFSVLTASGGREAIRLFREHQQEVSCVLLDLTMPDLDGAETFRELRNVRSEVRVILSSGYSEEAATAQFAGQGLAGFLQKPYTLSTLIARIQEAVTG